MARLFGFFDTSSDQDQAFLNLELPSNKYTRLKEVWLDNYKLNGLPYPYNDIMKVTTAGFPNEVIQWFRVYFYQPDTNEISGRKQLPDPTQSLSNTNEQDAFQALKDVVRDHLALYKTTMEEDEALLEAGVEDPRTKLIIQIRLAEKKSFHGAVESLNQRKVFVGEAQQALFQAKSK